MKYKNPNTGLGTFSCVQIVKPVPDQAKDMFQLIDTWGRNWLCCETGSYIMADITITDDPLVNHFANALGEPVFTKPIGMGYGMAPSQPHRRRGDNWIGRIITVDTPSIEELSERLSIIAVNIDGRRIYPDLPQPNNERHTKKIGSSALDPKQPELLTSEGSQPELPSFLNTLRSLLKRE